MKNIPPTCPYSLFISDLHLNPKQPKTAEAFFVFLETYAVNADALYILGDFFDVWLGDDDITVFNERVKTSLATLTAKGVPVYFMHGNRDVLIGHTFLNAAGCQLLPEPSVIDLYGSPTLIMHGDSLCTDDQWHCIFRYFSRLSWVKSLLLRLPLACRRVFLMGLRKRSQQRMPRLNPRWLDVNPSSVLQAMTHQQVSQMIHGHTHKPAVHPVLLNAHTTGQRFVLGAWENAIYALVYQSDGHYYVLTDAC